MNWVRYSRLFTLLLGLVVSHSAYAVPPTQCVALAVAGGTGDAIKIPLLPCTATSTLLILTFKASNTISAPTISENGRTPFPIVSFDGTALAPGALAADQHRQLTFNGAKWFLLNQPGGSVAGLNQITGDVLVGPGTGSQPGTVVGIRGRPVDPTAPAIGDVYTWDGAKWIPGVGGGGGGGINQLLGPVTAGPGTGAQSTTITPTGVVAGNYTVSNGSSMFCWTVLSSGQIASITAGTCGGGGTFFRLIDTGGRRLTNSHGFRLTNGS